MEELYISLYRGDRQGFHRDFVLDMPKLKALNLDARNAGRSDIHSLMVALRAPALRKMKIVMWTPNSEDDRDTVLNDFLPQDDYPILEDLTLRMSTTGSLAFATFHIPFTKLRALRSLCLDTPGLYPYICKSNTQGGWTPSATAYGKNSKLLQYGTSLDRPFARSIKGAGDTIKGHRILEYEGPVA